MRVVLLTLTVVRWSPDSLFEDSETCGVDCGLSVWVCSSVVRHCARRNNLRMVAPVWLLTCETSLPLCEAFRRDRVFRLVDAIPVTPELGNCVCHTRPQAGAGFVWTVALRCQIPGSNRLEFVAGL